MTTDVENIANEVLTRLDKIGDWLYGSGTQVLAIYTEKAAWESVSFFLASAVFLSLACIPAWYTRVCWRGREDSCDAHFVPLGLLTTAVGTFGLFMAYSGVMRLGIPEYYAIQELLLQIR